MFSTVIPRLTIFTRLRVVAWRQKWRLAPISIGVLVLASCAVSPIGDGSGGGKAGTAADTRREMVAERVKARWDALIKGDVDASYAFLSPASRGTIPLEQYKQNTRKRGFRDAKIEGIDCDEQVCKVRISLTYDHRLMKGITTPLEETWVIDKGQAWYVYRG
jgi:hypothetical protein